MVSSYRGSSDELHTAALKQFCIASRARTNNQYIRIPDLFNRELLGFEHDNLGIGVKDAFNEWYIFVDQYAHAGIQSYLMLSISRTGPQYTVTQPIAWRKVSVGSNVVWSTI